MQLCRVAVVGDLSALVQFKHVSTEVIVNATDISERKIQSVLKDLHLNPGIRIKKKERKILFISLLNPGECLKPIFQSLNVNTNRI